VVHLFDEIVPREEAKTLDDVLRANILIIIRVFALLVMTRYCSNALKAMVNLLRENRKIQNLKISRNLLRKKKEEKAFEIEGYSSECLKGTLFSFLSA